MLVPFFLLLPIRVSRQAQGMLLRANIQDSPRSFLEDVLVNTCFTDKPSQGL